MTDTIRIVPAADKFPGMTEITRSGRTIACAGTGKHVEAAICNHLDQHPERRGRV